jgi:putative nucleotidyltransferase with HDIG domain
MGVKNQNFRRLLATFQTLAELGTELTSESGFAERAQSILKMVMDAVDAREGALFLLRERPALLAAVASSGFSSFPERGVIPLLPRHVHALTAARDPQVISSKSWELFLSSNGNIAPELFKCLVPLRVGGKLAGLLALGHRAEDSLYAEDDLEALRLTCHYVALAVHNHILSESLATRVSEHLRLLGSVQSFYDNALETFAHAIDIKHVNIRGHSVRVGRYSAGIAEAMGMDAAEVAGIRAAGYLHDIGKVSVDKRLFGKAGALDAEEFREMADHTTVGYQIVQGVHFPWPRVTEVVRSHHERADRSGYPDSLAIDEISMPVRIAAVSDTFDAMTTERPYRRPLAAGEALSEIVRITPQKFDPSVVQALLIQVRRDAVGSNRNRFLAEGTVCNIAPADVDVLAAALNHKLTQGRVYSA